MKDLRARLTLGTVLVAALVGIFALDRTLTPWLGSVLIALLALAAQQEFYAMLAASGERPRRVVGGLMGAVVLAGGNLHGFASGGVLAVPVAGAYLSGEVLSRRPEGAPRRIGATLLGWIVVPVLLSSMISIRGHWAIDGWAWLLFLVVVCKAGDSCAYLVGSSLGRRRLIPEISPNKTWEGAAGSLAGSLLGAWAVVSWAFEQPPPLAAWLTAAVLTNLGAQFGDLVESLLKRGCASKDSAKVLPAFGGTFDLVDSFLLAAPVLAWILPTLLLE